MSPGVETRVNLPDALPTSGWTHMAIQIRADGEPSLVVNRERVATSPVLLETTPLQQWNIRPGGRCRRHSIVYTQPEYLAGGEVLGQTLSLTLL